MKLKTDKHLLNGFGAAAVRQNSATSKQAGNVADGNNNPAINVSAPLVGAGEVGDERAGGARHVRLQGELLGGRALVLPGEGLQPDAVVGEGFCNLNEDRLE